MSKKLHHRAHHSTTQAASRCLRTHQVSKPWVQVDRLDVHDDSCENVCDHCFFRISSSEFGCSTQLFHQIPGMKLQHEDLKTPSHIRPKSKWPSNRLASRACLCSQRDVDPQRWALECREAQHHVLKWNIWRMPCRGERFLINKNMTRTWSRNCFFISRLTQLGLTAFLNSIATEHVQSATCRPNIYWMAIARTWGTHQSKLDVLMLQLIGSVLLMAWIQKWYLWNEGYCHKTELVSATLAKAFFPYWVTWCLPRLINHLPFFHHHGNGNKGTTLTSEVPIFFHTSTIGEKVSGRQLKCWNEVEGWGILIDRWYRCASKTRGIFGNFQVQGATPALQQLLFRCHEGWCANVFRAQNAPFQKASKAEIRQLPWCEIMVKLWNFSAHREMIEWTPATWSLGIFIPPKPSRMIRVWKIKISYQRSLTQVRKPEVESKWRAALCWKTFRNVVNSIWKIDENTWK